MCVLAVSDWWGSGRGWEVTLPEPLEPVRLLRGEADEAFDGPYGLVVEVVFEATGGADVDPGNLLFDAEEAEKLDQDVMLLLDPLGGGPALRCKRDAPVPFVG